MTISLRSFFRGPDTRKYWTYILSIINTRNCESISTKSILNTNTSNEANSENIVLKNLRLKNSKKVIIGHINIISRRNKYELLIEMVRDLKLIYWWFPKQNLILHSQTVNFTWNPTLYVLTTTKNTSLLKQILGNKNY